MEIKTKYNIGDKVWVMADNESMEFTIRDIEVYIHTYAPQEIWYMQDYDEGYTEECVFPSKEELLKSL